MTINQIFARAISLESTNKFDKETAMSHAQIEIIEKMHEIDTEELKTLAIGQYPRMDDGSEITFETVMDELQRRLNGQEFTDFCTKLTA
jgi:hypothetical protein